MVLLMISINSALRPGISVNCITSIAIPNKTEIIKEIRMARRFIVMEVYCLLMPTIIRKQSTANMPVWANESKEKRSESETEGMEDEGSSVVNKITAAHSIVNRL